MSPQTPDTENLHLLTIGHFLPKSPWESAQHGHPFHELLVIVRGQEHILIDQQEYVVGEGQLFFFRKGTYHSEWTDRNEKLESYFINFDWDQCPDEMPLYMNDDEGRLATLSKWLYSERQLHSPHEKQVTRALLKAMCMLLLRSGTYSEAPMVTAVRSFIRANLSGTLTLDMLAAQAHMSRYHFLRKYRTLAGCTPMADVRMARLDHARSLIVTTDMPLKIIARTAGLGDEYQLSRLFRKHFKTCPSALRRTKSNKK